MFITRTAVPRRAFLRGIGATVALPLLDAMIPALTAHPEAAAPISRFGFVYVPHGVIIDAFLPSAEGAGFDYRPIMKPLEPLRTHVSLISNLTGPPDLGAGHVGASASFLTGATAKKTETEDVRLETSVDQHLARAFGRDTMFPSLELTTEDVSGFVGACGYGFSCAYLNTLCWATPTTPLPMEINPRVVFERMFGDSTSKERRQANTQSDLSILDSIADDAARMTRGLGKDDRRRLADYFEHLREIERRIRSAENRSAASTVQPDAPVGVPDLFDDHVDLLFDLMLVAFQTNITRVSTFMLGRELTNRTYPQAGVADPHHAVSHHQNNPANMVKHAKINTHHMVLFSRFLEKLRRTPDGDGTLLDHTLMTYGSGMGDGNLHTHEPLWLLLAGGSNGLKGDRHIRARPGTPLGNALVGIAAHAGVNVGQLGVSTGSLTL